MNQQRISPQVAVNDFNRTIAVGDWIRYRSIRHEGTGTLYRTKTKAEVLQGHTAVVWLEGKSGCVCCDHCDKATAEDIADIDAMIAAGAFVKTTPDEAADEIEALAKTLEAADMEWRKAAGYTGSAVHRPTYWWAMANHLTKAAETAKPPADYLLASVKHSRHGDPLVAWWRPNGQGYTTSVAEAGLFTAAHAFQVEDSSDATVAVPLSDLGRRLTPDDSGDRYPFTNGNAALLELLLANSCQRRNTTPHPRRIQLKRTKGWRQPEGIVRCVRPGPWGNPFKATKRPGGWLVTVCAGYRTTRNAALADEANQHGPFHAEIAATRAAIHACRRLHETPGRLKTLREHLQGKVLACWCPPGAACHVDTLLALENPSTPTTCDQRPADATAEKTDFSDPVRGRNAAPATAPQILTTADGPFPACFYTEEGLECSGCNWHGCEAQAVEREDPVNGLMHDCPECGEECAHCPLDEIRPEPTPADPVAENEAKAVAEIHGLIASFPPPTTKP